MVYETGDNTTTAVGEPEPMDLHYSRAVDFGEDYQVWAEDTDLRRLLPSDPHDDTDPDKGVPTELIGSGFCNEFDQLDQGRPGLEASEASLTANPGGQFLYGVWAQLEHPVTENNETLWDEVISSDAMARRVWWIDDYISEDLGLGLRPGVNSVTTQLRLPGFEPRAGGPGTEPQPLTRRSAAPRRRPAERVRALPGRPSTEQRFPGGTRPCHAPPHPCCGPSRPRS